MTHVDLWIALIMSSLGTGYLIGGLAAAVMKNRDLPRRDSFTIEMRILDADKVEDSDCEEEDSGCEEEDSSSED